MRGDYICRLQRAYGLAVRTPPFHGGSPGSIPGRVAIISPQGTFYLHRERFQREFCIDQFKIIYPDACRRIEIFGVNSCLTSREALYGFGSSLEEPVGSAEKRAVSRKARV